MISDKVFNRIYYSGFAVLFLIIAFGFISMASAKHSKLEPDWVINVSSSQVKSNKQIGDMMDYVYLNFHRYCPNKQLIGNTVDVVLTTVSTGNTFLYSSCINVVKGYHSSIKGMTCSLYYTENIRNRDKLQFIKDRIKQNVRAYCNR